MKGGKPRQIPAKSPVRWLCVMCTCMCVCMKGSESLCLWGRSFVLFIRSVILCISSKNHKIHVPAISHAAFTEPISKCFDEGKYLFSFLLYTFHSLLPLHIFFFEMFVCVCKMRKSQRNKRIHRGIWCMVARILLNIRLQTSACVLSTTRDEKECFRRPWIEWRWKGMMISHTRTDVVVRIAYLRMTHDNVSIAIN